MKIDVKELTMQIKIALQDVFEAQVNENGQNILLDFNNGQKFILKVNEK